MQIRTINANTKGLIPQIRATMTATIPKRPGRSNAALAWVPALLGFLLGACLSTYFSPTAGMISNVGRSLVEDAEHSDYMDEGHEGGEEGEGEEGFELAVSEAITCIVLLLIVLTIAFEKTKEKIEESADRNMKPIIQSLFGEVTVLGFLSLFTFCITKLGVFERLSQRIFGEEEAEELLELFESVHYALFFVMVTFVVLVLNLVRDGSRTESEWLGMDRECRNSNYISKCVDRVKLAEDMPQSMVSRLKIFAASAFPSIRQRRNSSVADLLHFYALRKEFILERSVTPPFEAAALKNQVPSDFNFGRYLSISLGHTLSHSVHLGVVTWLCIALFAIFFFLMMIATEADIVLLAWVWAGVGILIFVMGNVFDVHLNRINQSYGQFSIGSSSCTGDTESQPLVPNNARDELPPWCNIDLDKYMTSRPFLSKCSKTKPNRQDSLFYFERSGPHYSTLFFQLNLIFTAIYSALLLLTFLPSMFTQTSILTFIIYSTVSIMPLILSTIQRRHIAALMTQAITMGIHRKPQIVSHVLVEEKTCQVVRAFIIINRLMHAARHGLLANSPTEIDLAQSLGPVERSEIVKTFNAFDPDQSGYISPSELKQIFLDLGADLNDEMMNNILHALDEDMNGKICRDEFVAFYARHIMFDNDEKSINERAHDMFKLFDRSGDADITIGEFKVALDALNINFTVDEVGALIEELDEDDKGTVGVHEFHHLLHKFDSLFKPHQPRELPLV